MAVRNKHHRKGYNMGKRIRTWASIRVNTFKKAQAIIKGLKKNGRYAYYETLYTLKGKSIFGASREYFIFYKVN